MPLTGEAKKEYNKIRNAQIREEHKKSPPVNRKCDCDRVATSWSVTGNSSAICDECARIENMGYSTFVRAKCGFPERHTTTYIFKNERNYYEHHYSN